MLAVGVDTGEGVERFRTLQFIEAFLHEFGVAQDRGERRPQLMAHVGHELVLVLARYLKIFYGLCKLTCASLYLLEQPRVLDRDDGLVGKGLQESYLSI